VGRQTKEGFSPLLSMTKGTKCSICRQITVRENRTFNGMSILKRFLAIARTVWDEMQRVVEGLRQFGKILIVKGEF